MKMLITAFALLVSASGFAQENLSSQIPYPFYVQHDQAQNQVMNIEFAPAALQMRIEMIRRANSHIAAEYFIFNTDMAGKIIARELVAAAARGVKVRILVDKSVAVFELNEYYAKEFSKHGIEVRYYNAAPMVRVSTVQFRNHRKLLAVDDLEAITGGRNIGDDYFNLSPKFNFNDRDIYVKGPIVKTMRKSFDKFFEHKIAERPEFPSKSILSPLEFTKYEKKSALARAFFVETKEEVAVRNKIRAIGGKLLAEKTLHTCPTATFSTDAPGADFIARLQPDFDENYRFLRKTLFDKVSTIDKSILISSPYILNNANSRELMNGLLAKKVGISIYTNSLGSTDAVYVAANLYLSIQSWLKMGIDVNLHDGKYIPMHEEVNSSIPKAKWGTHCKSQVYESHDYTEVVIGTYNVDNRSNFYNSEMAFFCKGNDKFTKEVKDSILSRAKQGLKVHRDGTATGRNGEVKDMHSASQADVLKMDLITLPSWALKFIL